MSARVFALLTSTIISISLFPFSTSAQKSRPATVNDLMAIKTLIDTQISPDGSQILYVAVAPDLKESKVNTDVWMVSSAGGSAVKITNSPATDDTPRWSPDGKQFAFLSTRDGKSQIWVINPTGGEASKLTDAKTAVTSFEWSLDGRRIAFLSPDPSTDEEDKKQRERDDTLVVDKGIKMSQVHVIDVENKESKQLTKGDFHVIDLAWSPDGKHIAFSHQKTPKAQYGYTSDISVVSLDSGQVRKLVEQNGADNSPRWSPDGKQIAFSSQDGKLDLLTNTSICSIPAQGGTPRNISKSFDNSANSFNWAPDSRTIYFAGDGQVTVQLYSLAVETGKVSPVTSGQRVHSGFSFTKDASRMAFLAQTPMMPAEVYVSNVSAFDPRKLTETNPQVRELALGQTEVIRWKSSDGLEIEGLLIKPVNYEAGKRYPLLTYVHGGPPGTFTLSFTPQLGSAPIPLQAEPYPVQVFAGQGYAVFCPNPRGSSGYGEKFRKANIKDWGQGDYKDIMSGIDHLISLGIADADRLGIMGWSYGGYMTSWVITQTDRFKAASVGAGVTNVHSFYGQTDIPIFLLAYFGDKPWNDLEVYKKSSAMFHAARIKTPTLIQHGEKDDRVPLPQGQELYIAIKENNVPVEFAVYPRQGHLIMEPKLQHDMLTRNLDWFNRWIKSNTN